MLAPVSAFAIVLLALVPLSARGEPAAAPCVSCHGSLSRDPVKHPPAKGECSTCHEADPSKRGTCRGVPAGQGWKLADEEPKLCGGCHDLEAPKVAHGAFATGRCSGCHDPHSAKEERLLRGSGNALCLRCHGAEAPVEARTAPGGKVSLFESFKPGGKPVAATPPATAPASSVSAPPGKPSAAARVDLTKKVVHPPVREGDCADCHEAGHGGARGGLLTKPAEKLCATCHQAQSAPRKFPHSPVQDGDCVACHDPHSSDDPGLLRKKAEKLCLSCHDAASLAPQRHKHLPVAQGRCLDCHDPHGSDQKATLRAEPGELCLKCHDASAPPAKGAPSPGKRIDLKEAQATVHGAMEAGCTSCHSAGHASDNPRLLRKPTAELCAKCHDRVDRTPQVHSAVKLGECSGCHAPHTSKNEHLLRQANIQDTCFRCHQDDLTGRAVVHPPVAEGACDTCHGPHGGPNPNGLKKDGNALCQACHDTGAKAAKVKHAAVEFYGCTACHDPHASGNPKLLAKPVNALCGSCHPAGLDGKHVTSILRGGHKVSGGPDPRKVERDFSCVSCHAPHGSDHSTLFYDGADAIGSCDGCHGNISGRHPGAKDISDRKRPKAPKPAAAGKPADAKAAPKKS